MPPHPLRATVMVLSALLIVALTSAGPWLPASSAERAGWRADLADLEHHVSRSYANLEWFVTRGRVDPRALHDSTLAALERARTRRDARRALQEFATHGPRRQPARLRAEPRRRQQRGGRGDARRHRAVARRGRRTRARAPRTGVAVALEQRPRDPPAVPCIPRRMAS